MLYIKNIVTQIIFDILEIIKRKFSYISAFTTTERINDHSIVNNLNNKITQKRNNKIVSRIAKLRGNIKKSN